MARLDVVIAHDHRVIPQVFHEARHQVRHVRRHIVEIISRIVSLQVVTHVDEDRLHAGGTQPFQVRRHIGQRRRIGHVVDIQGIEVGAMHVRGRTDRHLILAVGERPLRGDEGDQAADTEADAKEGNENGGNIQYVLFHVFVERNYNFTVNSSASSLTGKRPR